MDDLSGLDWSSQSNGGGPPKKPPMNPMSYASFSTLQPTPSPQGSGRSTPQTQGSFGSAPKPPPTKPAEDSFSNLMKFAPAKSNQNLTLAERQAQLEAEKRKKLEEQKRLQEAQFGNGQFWDSLGTRGATSSPALQSPPSSSIAKTNEDDDLFAAFNKDTKVDNASHFPPPESQRSTPALAAALDLSDPSAWGSQPANGGSLEVEDDDPFELNAMKQVPSATTNTQQSNDTDDFMGDLARPVEEIRKQQAAAQPPRQPGKPIEEESSSSDDELAPPARHRPERRPAQRQTEPQGDEFDSAVAKLVDYGFAPDDARRGLTESGAGLNVQAAANWLLDDAHRKSKAKAEGRSPSAGPRQPDRRMNSRSPAASVEGDADFAKTAAAMGSTLFKTAGSLWKTSQKKVQQAMNDFQQDGSGGDPNQPKWMRDAQQAQRQDAGIAATNVTDEALALDSGSRPQPTRSQSRPGPERGQSSNGQRENPRQPSSSRASPVPRWQQKSAPPASFDAKAKLKRLEADDDLATYSSPNRWRRPQAAPAETKAQPEPDLLINSDTPGVRQPIPHRPAQQSAPSAGQRPKPASPAPPKPARQVPPISPDALQKSTRHRIEGTAHFKRGDFAAAHASYSTALNAVPPTHPLAILLLSNRALTALKTGEPKQAVEDAEQAIKLIGPGNGQGETIGVQSESGASETRDMRDLYGKSLSRKAEALEQMERWNDALVVWRIAIEAGLGGANALKGRQRCQTAIAPKPRPVAKPRPKPSAVAGLAPAKSSEAVIKLREANQAAAKEDDEKFALSEAVDAKISRWRDGKRDNLRALLGSLDTVLWEGSGWKKVGMHELVMANKVKIAYMKAIAKTHPDKLPQDASTEVRLIAGLVFSTLNESWDKFKAENGI